MSRRLVESGMRFVHVLRDDWDHHEMLKKKLPESCRQIDQPVAALIQDLKQRGLLDSTLIVWSGEFGRQPVVQGNKFDGRDHNPHGFSLLMAGGGPVQVEPIAGISEADLAKDWQKKWHKKTPPPTKAFLADQRFKPIRLTCATGVELNFLPGIGTATFYGEHGHMAIARNRFDCHPAGLVKDPPDESVAKQWSGAGNVARPHLQNWLDCIVSRQAPNAPVEVGHRTATVCHLVNIARELNRSLRWNPANEHFVDDDEANELLDHPRRPGFELPTDHGN